MDINKTLTGNNFQMAPSYENVCKRYDDILANLDNRPNKPNTRIDRVISSADSDAGLDEYTGYSELIKENLDWEILCDRYPYDRELLEGIHDLILETVLCKSGTVLIARNEYPVQLVKAKFLKLHSGHIEYVVDCFKGNTSKVRNIKKYLLAALFNAPTTISGYYQAEVNHDMPQLVRNKYY